MNVLFEIPVKVISEPNWRGHWAEKARRTKEQKGIVYAHCLRYCGCKPKDDELPGSFSIALTRILGYRERAFDDDNLRGAFKAVRDGIAMYLGIDDGDKRLVWSYFQDSGRREKPGISVQITNI